MVDIRNIPHVLTAQLSRVAYRWLQALKAGIKSLETQEVADLYKTETDFSEALVSGDLAVLSIPESEDSINDENILILDSPEHTFDDYGLLALLSPDTVESDGIKGPSSATDNAISRFDGPTGDFIQNSELLLDDSGNLSKVNSDLNIACGPGKTIELQDIVYEDLQVSISNIKVPTSSAPTDRLYDHGVTGGVVFPVLGFALGDYVYFDLQTSHSMKINTILDSHIHYTVPTDGTGKKFQFQLDVIAAPIGGVWSVPTGSPYYGEKDMSYDYSTYHSLKEIGDIAAVNTSVSTVYKCKLTRIAASIDEYSGEVYIEFIDSHYQKNTMGSRTEGAK